MKPLLFLIIIACSFHATSQCFLAMDEMEEIDTHSNSTSITQHTELQIREEFLQICKIFQVNPTLNFYVEPGRSNAYAKCEDGYEVNIGEKLARQELVRFNSAGTGLVGAIAHEVAHIYLCENGFDGTITENEHLADFLAGYVLALRSYFRYTNIAAFGAELYEMGDSEFTDEQHHGTPEERVRFMTLGSFHSRLMVNHAYTIGMRWVEGTVGDFDLNGLWRSSSGNRFRINQPDGVPAIECININNPGIRYTAAATGENMFRASFFNFNVLTNFYDLMVISEDEILVTEGQGGTSMLWERMN